jgi:hypothetical protein
MEEHLLRDHLTRYATVVRFRYHRTAESTYRPDGGRTRDLNLRGAWVELPERVGARSTLEIALDTPAGDVPLVAHVAWTCPADQTAPFLHGLRFTGITPAGRDRMRALLAAKKSVRPVRLYCGLAGTCQAKGIACPALPSAIRDLSDRGAGLRISEPVAPGTEVGLRIATPYGQIVADAQVIWADEPSPLLRGAWYRHGLRFLRVDPWSELPLQAFLCGMR